MIALGISKWNIGSSRRVCLLETSILRCFWLSDCVVDIRWVPANRFFTDEILPKTMMWSFRVLYTSAVGVAGLCFDWQWLNVWTRKRYNPSQYKSNNFLNTPPNLLISLSNSSVSDLFNFVPFRYDLTKIPFKFTFCCGLVRKSSAGWLGTDASFWEGLSLLSA